jgi:hypothetical protein
MFDALKIFFLTVYFSFIYLLTESFLMALVSIPLFTYLELIKVEPKNTKKTMVALFLGTLLPALIYFYFSFLPGRSDPSVPIATVTLNAILFGLFGGLLIGLRRLSDYLHARWQHRYWKKETRELICIGAAFLLLPLLVSAHIQYKIVQEKAFDKEAESLLLLLQTSQQANLIELGSYQKDLKALGFTAKSERYHIYLEEGAVPPQYASVLNAQTKPYVEKDTYQALLALKNPHSHTMKFFISNHRGDIRQLKKQLPLK